MKSTLKRLAAFLLVLALLIPCLPLPGAAAQNYTRLSGKDRYATSLLAADALKQVTGADRFDAIILASGTGFADALAGSYLAAVKGAPILLASDSQIPNIQSYIRENLADGGTVYLLGGKGAVSTQVEESLAGFTLRRLSGSNRYATNLAILEEAGLGDREVLIATGKGFADSLSASAVGRPILLVGDSLTAEQEALLAESSGEFVIIGGKGAVSPAVENKLKTLGNVTRLSGKSRYETSVEVAAYFFDHPSQAVLAYAQNFPDGLSGGPLAYALGAPLLLTATGSESAAAGYTWEQGITAGYVLGGKGLISDETVDSLFTDRTNCEDLDRDHFCDHCGDRLSQCADSDSDNYCDHCGKKLNNAYDFSPVGYVTTAEETIDTGALVFHIGENVFVPGHLREVSAALAQTLPQVTGLPLTGNGYGCKQFRDGNIHITATRDSLYGGQDWFTGLDSSELGSAWADITMHASVCPGDLFLYDNYAIIHEVSHVLRFKQTGWFFTMPLEEGFAEFTTHQVLKALEETNPTAAYYLGRSCQTTWNMFITDYDALYAQPVEYWLENEFPYSGNPNYVVGFRFMWYLQEVYGSYTKWLTDYEAASPYTASGFGWEGENADPATVLESMKQTYGADVFDKFYPWLRANEALFEPKWDVYHADYTDVEAVNLYPRFWADTSYTELYRMDYEDLYVNLESVRTYLEDYKGINASALTLYNPGKVTVNLYRADGSYTTVSGRKEVSLKDISYIKLVGKGQLDLLRIYGYEGAKQEWD